MTQISLSVLLKNPTTPTPMKITTTLLYPLAMFAALASLAPISAHAVERSPEEVLNIDFNSTSSGELSPTFSGVSPLGGGVFWNGLTGNGGGGVAKAWNKGLMKSDAFTESEVTISQAGFFGANTFLFERDGVTPNVLSENALLVDLISTVRNDDPGELTISGLKPNTPYDLALFGRASDIGARFIIGTEEKATSGKGPSDLPMEEGRDYVLFSSIDSGPNGEIVVVAAGTTSGAYLSGLSIAPSK